MFDNKNVKITAGSLGRRLGEEGTKKNNESYKQTNNNKTCEK